MSSEQEHPHATAIAADEPPEDLVAASEPPGDADLNGEPPHDTVAPNTSPDAVLEGLNDSQRAAVTHLGGPLLIVAGAGSGKTRTLTRRFEWLVRQGVPVERVLALTYTKDAAGELAERIEHALGEHVEETNATTFHALCGNILRDESAATGINPFFTTATEADRVAIMLARLNELSFEHVQLRGNPAKEIGELLKLIDRLKEECVGPEELLRFAEGRLVDAVEPEERAEAEKLAEQARFYERHEHFLREAGALDFGGMQLQTYRSLSDDEDARRRVARRWDHVLVDEFQDTSYVQLEILRLLTLDHRNIAAVGDDDQSIYRFRGASPRSIVNFGERFGEHTRIELELNYRSAPAIIAAARGVVGMIGSERRVDKQLTAAEDKPGEVMFWHCANESAEAQAIVSEIEHLIAEADVQPRDICVLVSKRKHCEVLSARLAAHQIPFVLDSRDFFKRAEIRIPLSWLKVLANPQLNEDAWRMLCAPPIGVDSAEYAALMRWMTKNKLPDVIAALRDAVARGKQFSPETLDKLRGFLSLFDELAAGLDESSPSEYVIRLVHRIALKGTLVLRGGRGNPDRLANLGKLQRMAQEFASRRPQATAREFALYISAMSEAGFEVENETAEHDPNSVRVMTAHGAKGLEFEYVFMPGMNDDRWPGRRTPGGEVPASLIRDPAPDPPGKDPRRERHVEDQRRLVHVAMTRARTRLVLSRFDSNSKTNKISRFYAEALALLEGEETDFQERPFEPSEFVFAELEHARAALMHTIDEAGAQLVEMRLDAHAGTPEDFARFAELIKLSALSHRLRHGQTIAEALPEINQMLTASMSPAQRAGFDRSELDERLLAGERYGQALERTLGALTPQLGNYVPTVGDRLRLSASDISTYQRCPKMYEYEKVMRIPVRDRSHLRLGILVHNVLERFHRDLGERRLSEDEARGELERLLEAGIATGGWGSSDDERQLLARAREMLSRYARGELAHPEGTVATEIMFSLKLPPSPAMADVTVGGKRLTGIQINGKIDRIDRNDGQARLIDYKTGKKRTPGDLKKDLQLAIYRIAAEEVLGIEASSLTYYFLESDQPVVAAEAGDERVAEVRETINQVADRVVRLEFDPTPSYQICQFCAFSGVCPATEA
ncbi:MAG: ATP-dependent helicase [Actinobacteria bacterium]|nr:ATP-dependent helicase [Actinomycetota bacterium]